METIVFVGVSLDGFIARADGAVDFLEPGESDPPIEDDMGFSELMQRCDAMLMGRNTFDFVIDSGFDWPYGETPVFVATRRPLDIPDHLTGTVHAIAGSPAEMLEELEAADLSVIYLDGGDIAHQFFAAELVDEVALTVVPRLIGSGISLFGDLDRDQQLKVVHTNTYPNGYVRLVYRKADT